MMSILTQLHKNASMDLKGIIKVAAPAQTQQGGFWNGVKNFGSQTWKGMKGLVTPQETDPYVDHDYNQRMNQLSTWKTQMQRSGKWDDQARQKYKQQLTQLQGQTARQAKQIERIGSTSHIMAQQGKGLWSGAVGVASDIAGLVGWDSAVNAMANHRANLRDSSKDKYGIVNDDVFNKAQLGGRVATQGLSYLVGGAALRGVGAAAAKGMKGVAQAANAVKALPKAVRGVGGFAAGQTADFMMRDSAKGSQLASHYAYANKMINQGKMTREQARDWLNKQQGQVTAMQFAAQLGNPLQAARYSGGKLGAKVAWNGARNWSLKNLPNAAKRTAKNLGPVLGLATDAVVFPSLGISRPQQDLHTMEQYRKDPSLLLSSGVKYDPATGAPIEVKTDRVNFADNNVNTKTYYQAAHFDDMLADPAKAQRLHQGWFVGKDQRDRDAAGLTQAAQDASSAQTYDINLQDAKRNLQYADRMMKHYGYTWDTLPDDEWKQQVQKTKNMAQFLQNRKDNFNTHARQSFDIAQGKLDRHSVNVWAREELAAEKAKPLEQQDQQKIRQLQMKTAIEQNTNRNKFGIRQNSVDQIQDTKSVAGLALGGVNSLLNAIPLGSYIPRMAGAITGTGVTAGIEDQIQQLTALGKQTDPQKQRQMVMDMLNNSGGLSGFQQAYLGTSSKTALRNAIQNAVPNISPEQLDNIMRGVQVQDNIMRQSGDDLTVAQNAHSNPLGEPIIDPVKARMMDLVADDIRGDKSVLDPNSKANQYIGVMNKYRDSKAFPQSETMKKKTDALQQEVQGRAWDQLKNDWTKMPDAVRMWLKSKGHENASVIFGNKAVAWGLPTLGLLLGGSMLFGGGDDEEEEQREASGGQTSEADQAAYNLANA